MDAKYLDVRYGTSAVVMCAAHADDYLRQIANYDFRWDDTGLFESKFDQYRTHVKQPGVLTSVSEKAKLQNGFGAFQHITLLCDYDTQAREVVAYHFEQP